MKIKKLSIIAIIFAIFFSVEVKAYENDFSYIESNQSTNSISTGGSITYSSFKINESFNRYQAVGIPVSLYRKEDDSFVQRQYIGEDKHAKFTDLDPGFYYVVEEVDNSAYLPLETHYIEINSQKMHVSYDAYYEYQTIEITFKVSVENYKFENKKIKYFYEGKKEIIYGLYKENGTLITILSSDEEGKLFFSGAIAPGTYYFKEFLTYDNYVTDITKYYFSFNRVGEEKVQTLKDLFSLKINLLKSKVDIHIDDYYTLKPANGITLTFLDLSRSEIMELTSDADGNITTTLPYGTYFIKKLPTFYDYEAENGLVNLFLRVNTFTVKLINMDPNNIPKPEPEEKDNDDNFNSNTSPTEGDIENNTTDDQKDNNGLNSNDESESNNESNSQGANNKDNELDSDIQSGEDNESKNDEHLSSSSHETLTSPDEEKHESDKNTDLEETDELDENINENEYLNDLIIKEENSNDNNQNTLLKQETKNSSNSLEVSLGATDKNILTVLFYFLSMLGLCVIKYAK